MLLFQSPSRKSEKSRKIKNRLLMFARMTAEKRLESLVIKGRNKKRRKLNIIRYADDFIVTGASPEILLDEIKPDLEQFLDERGLSLSEEKTKLSHLSDGFNFLGFNIRKYNQKLLIQPEDGKTQTLLAKVNEFLNNHRGIPFHVMLIKLNRIIRGWAYAYRRVVAKARMGYIDNRLYFLVRKWLRREHRSKTWAWIAKRYRRRLNGRVEFCDSTINAKGEFKTVRLFKAADLPIRYHIKIQGKARRVHTIRTMRNTLKIGKRNVNLTHWLTECI